MLFPELLIISISLVPVAPVPVVISIPATVASPIAVTISIPTPVAIAVPIPTIVPVSIIAIISVAVAIFIGRNDLQFIFLVQNRFPQLSPILKGCAVLKSESTKIAGLLRIYNRPDGL